VAAVYLGIDPGLSGGLAVINAGGLSPLATRMPVSHHDILHWLRKHKGGLGVLSFAVVEKVGAMPTDGRSSLARFMMNYGALQMALVSIAIPYEIELPTRWQQGLHISPRKKSEGRVLWKNRLKANAQRLFPEIADKITLATADALLLAEYCRRLREGRL
jgi:crossover junction endodeoxyribonuclease RuvC